MSVAIALFAAGLAMGLAAALIWSWAVRAGQMHDLERTKQQLFWPDIAPAAGDAAAPREGHDERRSFE